MDLTFLSARVPLTKTISFNPRDDAYTVTPYPMVSRVTSHLETAASLQEFAALLRKHGELGHCLLKGSVDMPLENMSRAGHAVEADHEWVVFDFDKVDCAPTFEGAVAAVTKYLPRECAQADMVVQLSASCFHPKATRLSAHVFMQLETPASTQTLKEWFEWINFNSPLAKEMSLTDSQLGLHFPLDRTVGSPSRLIYIAPPRLVGFARDTDSIRFVKGKTRTVKIAPFTPISSDVVRDKINALRRAAGLPEREYRTVMTKGREFLLNSEECVVHDIQKSGEMYLRFNLNGGDSMAYYVNLREPHVIGNFKGEPFLYTREAAPDFFKRLVKAAQAMPAQAKNGETVEPLAFYATNRGSGVYIGYYDRATDVLRLDPSTESAAKSWLLSFGVPPMGPLPHMDMVFDMQSDIRYEPGYPIVNLYRQTDFMKEYANPEEERTLDSLGVFEKDCPVLYKTMLSITGNSPTAVEYLVNWLAHVFQTRTRTNTAWIWHGTQGTGKGMFINNVIVPLFGESLVRQVLYSLIDTKFNAFMDGALILVVDEAALSSSIDREDLMSKLKNWITEPTIQVIEKNKTERKVENNANIIFCTNSSKPVVIESGDRRLNVGEHQPNRLIYTPNEFAILTTGEELPKFAQYLGLWVVNQDMLLKPYEGQAKDRMFEATHTLVERIAKAIHTGETDFFLESRPSDLQVRIDHTRMLPLKEYDQLLKHMLDNTLNVLKREDMYVLFRVVVGTNDRMFPENSAEQRRVYHKLGLIIDRSTTVRDKRTGRPTTGFKLTCDWQRSEHTSLLAAEVLKADAPEAKIVPFK